MVIFIVDIPGVQYKPVHFRQKTEISNLKKVVWCMHDIQPLTDMFPTYKDTVSVIKMFLDPICDLLALPVA